MVLSNEFQSIREWADEKGIFDKSDLKSQTLKVYEEAGELAKAVLNDDIPEIEDAIGDIVVVLTNVAELASIKYGKSIKIEDCINDVYDIISKRKGKMQNGAFVKQN